MQEGVFRALGDESRRRLLDRLFERDGQTLGELVEGMDMTRFGVMKHLRVLEAAGLVATRKVGREKLHYLNPVPIRLVHDRWISKYAEPLVGEMARLKSHLEAGFLEKPRHVYEVYIRTTPDRLWEAITSGDLTRRYFHSTCVESSWQPGTPVHWRYEGRDDIAVEGIVLESDPPRRLVHTWHALYAPETAADRPSRVTWEISPMGETCLLVLTHDDFDGETATYRGVEHGWVAVLHSLKSLIETGEPLDISERGSVASGA
jgi:uncharacterized protein YndB with AHSA1/START domain